MDQSTVVEASRTDCGVVLVSKPTLCRLAGIESSCGARCSSLCPFFAVYVFGIGLIGRLLLLSVRINQCRMDRSCHYVVATLHQVSP